MTKQRIRNEMPTQTENSPASLARTLLVLAGYDWLRAEAQAAGVTIIPIKGIDLLQTLYAERLDRQVRDIDVVVVGGDEACRKLAERLCREEEYRLEFPFALQPEALASKKKVSLLSCSLSRPNVDIHTQFVTKKFFSQFVGTFNADAFCRCHDGRMDALDRWLFLAQHAAFHLFADDKWTRDLALLWSGFSEQERLALSQRATDYGFWRVLLAALYHTGQVSLHPSPLATSGASGRRFLRFVSRFDRPFTRKAFDRLVAAHWEFAFIQRRNDRCRAWLRLMLPSRGTLTNIYKVKSRWALPLFYVLNIVVAGATSMVFWATYAVTTLLLPEKK